MLKNMEKTGGLFYAQRVMLGLVESGLSREESYSLVQRNALRGWEEGKPLLELLKGKPEQLSFSLGHELSHYLMEHGTSDRNLQFGLSMLQVRHHRVAGHGTTV